MPPKKKSKNDSPSKKEKAEKKASKKAATKKTAKKSPQKKPNKKKASKKSPVVKIDIPTAAYFNYLERLDKGLPGNETTDWLKAEEDAK